MRRATDSERLLNALVNLESRAAAHRPNAAPGSAELRQLDTEHGHLLGEWVKVVIRERLAGRTRPTLPLVQGADQLTDRRAVLTAATFALIAGWDADQAAGRALPPATDAVVYAASTLERNP